MTIKKWNVGSPNREFAKEAAEEFGIDPFSALLAYSRGISDLNELEYFLSDELLITDPKTLIDVDKAKEVINETIDMGLKIAIFGDYDCDGVCATAILYKYLKSRNADVTVFIPDRIRDGYGMNCAAIDKLKLQGVELIITVDNGIASKKEVDYAAKLGIVTVITDHHIAPDVLPDAAAVVDPNRPDCPSEFKQICGAEVIFKVICVIEDKEPEELIDDYAELLALATIGDSMPLKYENRSIVKYGLSKLKNSCNVGISAILSVSGIDKSNVDSAKLSYGIIPRINAAGRMSDALRAFELLTSEKIFNAITLANSIENDNANRQTIEKQIVESAIKTIEANGYQYDDVIVVSGQEYHFGVIGIAAIKICEKYSKPTFVFSSDGIICHGSCRSIEGFNIYDAIKSCEELTEKFGGHALAAGITIKDENLDAFRTAVNRYAKSVEMPVPQLNIDFKLKPAAISLDMVDAIKALEPFGNGNPSPLFGIFDSVIKDIIPVSHGKHIKLLLSKDNYNFEAMLFGVSQNEFCFDVGSAVDIAVTIDTNEYMGNIKVSTIIRAVRPSGFNEDRAFSEKKAVDKFFGSHKIDSNIIAISRDDVVLVYKSIKAKPTTYDGLLYRHFDDIGIAKTAISVKILTELNILSQRNGIIYISDNSKTDLMLSKTYVQITCAEG